MGVLSAWHDNQEAYVDNSNTLMNIRAPRIRLFLTSLLVTLLVMAPVHAASFEPSELDFAELEAAIASTSELSDQDSGQLSDRLKLARLQLTGLQQRRADIETYRQEADDFDTTATALQDKVQAFLELQPGDEPLPTDEKALSSTTTELEANVRQLSQELFESRESEARLSERAGAIAQEMGKASEQIDEASLSMADDSDWQQVSNLQATPLVGKTRTFLLRVQSHVALELIKLQQVELSTLAPRQTLASLNSRLLQLELDSTIEKLDRFWGALSDARLSATHQQLDQLMDDTTGRDLGDTDIMKLLRDRVSLLEQELPILRRTSAVSQSILNIYQIRLILARVTNTGAVNDTLAVTVSRLREELPEKEALDTELEQLRGRLRELQVNQILWEANLRNFRSGELFAQESVTQGDSVLAGDRLSQQIALLSVANRVADRMVTLEAVLIETQTRASEVRTTLDGSVLWLRTNEALGLEWIKYGYSALKWMVSLDTWRGLDVAVFETIQLKIFPLSLLTIGFIGLVAIRSRLKKLLLRQAERVGNVGDDDYWNTPLAFFYSLLMALPVPWLLFSAYTVFKDVFVFSGSVIPAISTSLLATSGALVVLLFFKALCRPNSVFRGHFSWNDHVVNRLNNHLNWFVWVFALCVAVYTFAVSSGRADLRYALGVSAFLLASLGMSAMLYALFHPNRGIAFEQDASRTASPFTRLGIWILIILPLLIGLLPLVGYFDTAVAIQERLFLTGILLMGVIIVVGALTREFMVAHRRMSLRKARAKRSALEAERSAQESVPVSGDATPDLSFAWDDDYKHTANEAQQLFNLSGVVLFLIGAWNVWKPMFPVLDNFNDIVLWQAATAADGAAVTDPVTLGKLLFAATLLLIGFVGARNLRSVLELLLFERLKLDTGTRYAVNAIASYTLLGTTLLIGIAQLGVDWSRLQWIVAALGVGLGFGLQEIVANFISGLIILFERPVRVGDTVTIGGISGTVSNIQIRATTLTDFDNREVILPNKSIITEDVTNWTLHDAVTRILLTIGVAYGSDIDKVRQLLTDCVETTEHVLETPEPTVFFVNHGASALDFEIRAFVATPAYRLPVTHALNAAINEKLAANGIEIPFPQQVVHMHTADD